MVGLSKAGKSAPEVPSVPTSILIPWYNRMELATTLRKNAAHYIAHASEVVVINCGGDARALREIIASVGDLSIVQMDIPSDKFNKSLALNLGLALANQNIILTLDCDICIGPELLGKGSLCTQERCFLTVAGLLEPRQVQLRSPLPCPAFLRTVVSEGSSEFVWEDGTKTKVLIGRVDICDGKRLGPGMTIAKRQDLLDIGGLCSEFDGWGWEDIDLHIRLQRCLGLRPVYLNDTVIHLTRDETKKTGRSRLASHEQNFNLACERYNRADFVGTHASDVKKWLDRCTIIRGSG